jgi:hypothetical protein
MRRSKAWPDVNHRLQSQHSFFQADLIWAVLIRQARNVSVLMHT